jgi:hypothetical protein
VEGAQGADSVGGAPDTFFPAGASTCFCLRRWRLEPSASTRREDGKVVDLPAGLAVFRVGADGKPLILFAVDAEALFSGRTRDNLEKS